MKKIITVIYITTLFFMCQTAQTPPDRPPAPKAKDETTQKPKDGKGSGYKGERGQGVKVKEKKHEPVIGPEVKKRKYVPRKYERDDKACYTECMRVAGDTVHCKCQCYMTPANKCPGFGGK